MTFSRKFSLAFERSNSSWQWYGSLFVHLSADAAQILRQHDASSVCPSKSSGTNFYKFLLLRQLHGQLGDDFDESQQALTQRDRRPLTWKAVQIWGRLRWTFCRFEMLIQLVTLRTAQTILSISLLQHLKSLRISPPPHPFDNKFNANVLLLKILHVSTCKKSPMLLVSK